MGKGRDKRKKQKGSSVAGHGASKTQKKTLKNERKLERRLERRLEDDEDIDALLEKFKLETETLTQTVIEEDCPPPSVRVHASYTSLPPEVHKDGWVMVFGGEYEDQQTGTVKMFNDLYRFNCERMRWTKIAVPNSPSPRSSHQTVYYRHTLYIFGGEFTSPKQDKFRHFKELWTFDLTTNEWNSLSMKRGPSARSGHRSIVFRNRMIIFGGFNDEGDRSTYYNDLWEFDFGELTWRPVGDETTGRPTRRAGFRMEVYGTCAYVFGGYSKFRDDEDKDVEHGMTVDDIWKLDLESYRWEEIKKQGVHPGIRSGFNMTRHLHRSIFFGGATDHEMKKGESIVSEFHNDLFQFNFERERWYTVQLRPPRHTKHDQLPGTPIRLHFFQSDFTDASTMTSMVELEEHQRRHKAAVKIQAGYRGYAVRKAVKVYKLGGKISELLYSPATYGFDLSIFNAPKPRGRISAGLCTVKNNLWLFGGIVEIFNREITLDDIWRLNLKSYDGWHCIQQNSVGEEAFVERPSDEESESEDEDTDDDEMDTD